ncbi:MAG TPA: hypothetical protein VM163_06180 [bacterium]|jgi:hypothetical protein|nr:hypothetical protein [bacterium]
MASRNVVFALLGAAGLVLRRSYVGPLQQIVHSYGGNLSVSFALYFASVSATRRYRHPRLFAALITLAAVTSFEITDGFGVMANVYDAVDLLANGAGVGFAVLVDLLSDRLMSSGHGDRSAVTEQALPADGRER